MRHAKFSVFERRRPLANRNGQFAFVSAASHRDLGLVVGSDFADKPREFSDAGYFFAVKFVITSPFCRPAA